MEYPPIECRHSIGGYFMSRKSKYDAEFKVNICKRYLSGESSIHLSKELGLHSGDSLVRRWVKKYQVYGDAAFIQTNHNRVYPKELKQLVIDEYNYNGKTTQELALKYGISTAWIVESWIKKYNNGIEIKDYIPKHEVYAMKSRKTTFEERIDIVKYVLCNNNDYKGAAEKFSVPYANVYQWVSKYNKMGEQGLLDRRGVKAFDQSKKVLTLEEKKDLEIEKLKRELERANMVIEVLKKKNELEEQFIKDSHSFAKDFCTKQSKNSK